MEFVTILASNHDWKVFNELLNLNVSIWIHFPIINWTFLMKSEDLLTTTLIAEKTGLVNPSKITIKTNKYTVCLTGWFNQFLSFSNSLCWTTVKELIENVTKIVRCSFNIFINETVNWIQFFAVFVVVLNLMCNFC